MVLADIAQLGERQTEDLKVPGSIPGGGTYSFASRVLRGPRVPRAVRGRLTRSAFALVAQSVEHGSNKPRVGGSSPSWSMTRSYSVMVITKDFESFDPGSSPGRTFWIL